MPLTTNDALLEAWAEQIETLEQNLETLYGPPGITPALPDITTDDGLLEAVADETEAAYIGFAKLYPATATGTSVDVTTESITNALQSVSLAGKTTDGNPLEGYDSYDIIDGTKVATAGSDIGDVMRYSVRTTNLPAQSYGVMSDLPFFYSYTSNTEHFYLGTASKIAYVFVSKTIGPNQDAFKEYLNEHPFKLWYKSTDYSAAGDQHYTMDLTEADGTYHGVGTTAAIGPLYAGDSLDFVSGTVTRSDDTTETTTISESLDGFNGNLTLKADNTLTVKYVKKW